MVDARILSAFCSALNIPPNVEERMIEMNELAESSQGSTHTHMQTGQHPLAEKLELVSKLRAEKKISPEEKILIEQQIIAEEIPDLTFQHPLAEKLGLVAKLLLAHKITPQEKVLMEQKIIAHEALLISSTASVHLRLITDSKALEDTLGKDGGGDGSYHPLP